ncbi:MAG: transcriptional repressor [Woeseia sp.]|nr:transcriptional repressor [Woeseia sp.]|tara:strand:+ start:689 stop:1093 length:405 start_codon:yes stop_codon:yes gene_type:complete
MSDIDIHSNLLKHDVLPTPQRIKVASVILDRPQHLSADQIMDRLIEKGSAVSKATVYNCLKLFCEKGLIKEINIDPSRKYYDSTTHAHHHFYHVQTGELTDIPQDKISIVGLPSLPDDTEQEGVEVLIRLRNKK